MSLANYSDNYPLLPVPCLVILREMKVIFSRKGWDSSAGGKASPILPSGELYSIPIPCSVGSPLYSSISPTVLTRVGFSSAASLIARLPGVISVPDAHLDPDLDFSGIKRSLNWKPCFGQRGRAARHLDNQGVGIGDLFLFYGWFDNVTVSVGSTLKYAGNDMYVIWGYLQIERILSLPLSSIPTWLNYHPHVVHQSYYLSTHPKNQIYIATDRLKINGLNKSLPGAGVFDRYHANRSLTKTPGKRGCMPDKLPKDCSKFRQEHVCNNTATSVLGGASFYFI